MNKKTFGIVLLGIIAIVVLGGGYLAWLWLFCRFYVPPGYMAIIIAKTGKDLAPGQILAKKGQKGIQEEVLGEGRYFLNPFLYEHEIRPITIIPPGKVGVVTSKVGKELPEGEFLANEGEKGILRNVLGPGAYRINPYGYTIDIVDAYSIPIGYVGVLTSLSGKQAPPGQFAKPGEKGVRKDILQPGFYYINPKAYKVDILEVGVNQVSLLGHGGKVITKGEFSSQNAVMDKLQHKMLEIQRTKRINYLTKSLESKGFSSAPSDSRYKSKNRSSSSRTSRSGSRYAASRKRSAVSQPQVRAPQAQAQQLIQESGTMKLIEYVEFPSRDGFTIRLDMTVEFELLPEYIAWIFNRYGDLLAVVDKVIMPQITSISRNKGSEYGAKDFIVGAGREKFQNDLTASLRERLKEKNIIVHNALIRHVEVPDQIRDPIQKASIAKEQDLTNIEKQNTAKKKAQLNTELALIDQKKEQVMQETEKMKAEILAEQEKEVAEIKALTEQKVAEINQQTAKVKADIVRTLGLAKANAVQFVEGEKARGLQLKVQAFGNPVGYAMLKFAEGLNSDIGINIIHAGEGTLWTDLERASLGELGGASIIQNRQKDSLSPKKYPTRR